MHARPGHILIVDDDPLNRRVLTKSLDSDGHRTTDVDNGFAALTALEADPPDVVLLDVVMPGLDGIEVLERIKSDTKTRHIPVIMISGVDDSESVVRCLEAGADDFLPKPFDPVIFRARIAAGLNRKRLTDLEQDRVRNVFTRFLPEPIAAQMLERNDGELSIRPVRLWATVMFADLRGVTSFAEDQPVENPEIGSHPETRQHRRGTRGGEWNGRAAGGRQARVLDECEDQQRFCDAKSLLPCCGSDWLHHKARR